MCCVTPGALSSPDLAFFRFYLGHVHFQECVIPVPHPDEGMLNDLVKPESPCFHTGADGPGIDGVLCKTCKFSKNGMFIAEHISDLLVELIIKVTWITF